jgi:hypothetical protein
MTGGRQPNWAGKKGEGPVVEGKAYWPEEVGALGRKAVWANGLLDRLKSETSLRGLAQTCEEEVGSAGCMGRKREGIEIGFRIWL